MPRKKATEKKLSKDKLEKNNILLERLISNIKDNNIRFFEMDTGLYEVAEDHIALFALRFIEKILMKGEITFMLLKNIKMFLNYSGQLTMNITIENDSEKYIQELDDLHFEMVKKFITKNQAKFDRKYFIKMLDDLEVTDKEHRLRFIEIFDNRKKIINMKKKSELLDELYQILKKLTISVGLRGDFTESSIGWDISLSNMKNYCERHLIDFPSIIYNPQLNTSTVVQNLQSLKGRVADDPIESIIPSQQRGSQQSQHSQRDQNDDNANLGNNEDTVSSEGVEIRREKPTKVATPVKKEPPKKPQAKERPKDKRSWTEAETNELIRLQLTKKYENKWALILKQGKFDPKRNSMDLRDKWRNLVKARDKFRGPLYTLEKEIGVIPEVSDNNTNERAGEEPTRFPDKLDTQPSSVEDRQDLVDRIRSEMEREFREKEERKRREQKEEEERKRREQKEEEERQRRREEKRRKKEKVEREIAEKLKEMDKLKEKLEKSKQDLIRDSSDLSESSSEEQEKKSSKKRKKLDRDSSSESSGLIQALPPKKSVTKKSKTTAKDDTSEEETKRKSSPPPKSRDPAPSESREASPSSKRSEWRKKQDQRRNK